MTGIWDQEKHYLCLLEKSSSSEDEECDYSRDRHTPWNACESIQEPSLIEGTPFASALYKVKVYT